MSADEAGAMVKVAGVTVDGSEHSLRERNKRSFQTFVGAAIYVALAFVIGGWGLLFTVIAGGPVIGRAINALQRGEKLAPLALIVAILAILIGF